MYTIFKMLFSTRIKTENNKKSAFLWHFHQILVNTVTIQRRNKICFCNEIDIVMYDFFFSHSYHTSNRHSSTGRNYLISLSRNAFQPVLLIGWGWRWREGWWLGKTILYHVRELDRSRANINSDEAPGEAV